MLSQKAFTFALLTFSVVVPSVIGLCDGEAGVNDDCCYGGTDNYKACYRQTYSATVCSSEEGEANWCINNGVTPEKCDADCCSISRKVCIGCPK